MKKIGLFYAPAKGNVEKVAKKIVAKIGEENLDVVLLKKDVEPDVLKGYDRIIFGISTVGRDAWNSTYSKIGWDFFLPKLGDFNFTGVKVAIFGLGNQYIYPQHFVDSMGKLGKKVIEKGGTIVGETPNDGYDFYTESEALVTNDHTFIGLPVDEDNEDDLTEERLNKWLGKVKPAFGL